MQEMPSLLDRRRLKDRIVESISKAVKQVDLGVVYYGVISEVSHPVKKTKTSSSHVLQLSVSCEMSQCGAATISPFTVMHR